MKSADFCKAFCEPIALRAVPIGFVLRTPFRRADGDPIAIYLRRDQESGQRYRLEDDGQTIGFLEASGVDLETETRQDALVELLKEHEAFMDEREFVLHSAYMDERELPAAAVRFTALMLRVIDLLLLSSNRVRSTFKDDLVEIVERQFGAGSHIQLNMPLQMSMKDYVVDIIVRAPDGRALAIFAGTSELKALEALLFWKECREQKVEGARSMLVLETAKPREIKERTLSRVMNSDILLAAMDGEEIQIRRKMQESLAAHA
jgi:hypothetical protein